MTVKVDLKLTHLSKDAKAKLVSYDLANKKAKVFIGGLIEQVFDVLEGTDEEISALQSEELVLEPSGILVKRELLSQGKASGSTAGCKDRSCLAGVKSKALFL